MQYEIEEDDPADNAPITWRVWLFCKPVKNSSYVLVPPYMIHPSSRFVASWDCFNAFFIVLCFFIVPYSSTFYTTTTLLFDFGGSTSDVLFVLISRVMDIFFMADVALRFRVCIIDDGELIVNPNAISRAYLRGWFLLDLISSTSILFAAATGVRTLMIIRNVKLLRLLQMLKWLSGVKAIRNISKIGEAGDVGPELVVLFKLLRFSIWCYCLAHGLACLFYAVGKLNMAEGDGWLVGEWGEDFAETESQQTIYLTALYWAFVTITTVRIATISYMFVMRISYIRWAMETSA